MNNLSFLGKINENPKYFVPLSSISIKYQYLEPQLQFPTLLWKNVGKLNKHLNPCKVFQILVFMITLD